MPLAAFDARNAQNDHDGKLHARGNHTLARCNGLEAVNTLVHRFQCNGIAAFHAVIQQLQPRFPQLFHLFRRFPQNILGRRIGRNTLQMGKVLPQRIQDTQQPIRAQHQRVPVCQKDTAHALPVIGIGQRHLPGDLFIRQHLERHAPVHITICTFIMGAAPGHPQDEAVGFAGGTEHRGIVVIKKHNLLPRSSHLNRLLPAQGPRVTQACQRFGNTDSFVCTLTGAFCFTTSIVTVF